MLPTLATGEYLLLTRRRYPINRRDIVVLRNPSETGVVFIKRIIGLPEEVIQLEGGLVYLNGVALKESYAIISPHADAGNQREWRTGPEEYFVMGDNRRTSQDSRYFGPVNRNLIIGRVWFRYWPPRAWGPVPNGLGSLAPPDGEG